MNWDLLISVGLKIVLVGLLVLLNGFFVAAEFALVKIRDTQLDTLPQKNSKRVRITRWVIHNLDSSLSACQLGITLASLALGWVGHPVFAALLDPVMDAAGVQSVRIRDYLPTAVGFSVITFLHIVAGEQAPKWLAIKKPIPTSLFVAWPLSWFYKASFPFIWVLNQSSLWLLRRLGIEPGSERELDHSEEELRLLFSTAQQASLRSGLGREIVLNALDLRRRIAREVMRPRQEIVGLNTEATIAECLEIAEKTRFSRFPLCQEGDLDRTSGVVHVKDLLALRCRIKQASELTPVARKIIYIPETARLEKVLQLFQERKLHFAIVVDEYGGTVGIVTLENILEELVGPIQDEFDQEKPLLQKQGNNTWLIEGAYPLHDLSELVGQALGEEDVTTASGFVTHRLGGFPKAGDVVNLDGYQLRVEEMDGPRVARLKLTKLEIETVPEGSSDGQPAARP